MYALTLKTGYRFAHHTLESLTAGTCQGLTGPSKVLRAYPENFVMDKHTLHIMYIYVNNLIVLRSEGGRKDITISDEFGHSKPVYFNITLHK